MVADSRKGIRCADSGPWAVHFGCALHDKVLFVVVVVIELKRDRIAVDGWGCQGKGTVEDAGGDEVGMRRAGAAGD